MLKRKDFILSIALTPLLALAGMGLVTLVARTNDHVRKVAVVREAGAAGADTLRPLAGYRWSYPVGAAASDAALRAALAERKLDAALRLPAGWEEGAPVGLWLRRELPGAAGAVGEHLRQSARPLRAASRGLDDTALAALDDSVRVRAEVTVAGARGSRADRIAALVLLLVLFVTIFGTYSYLMIGVAGEKQARFTEVVVSAIPAQAWIDGKVAAYTVLGLLQAVVYLGSGAALAAGLRFAIPLSFSPGMVAGATLIVALGLAFYNALIALVMATLKDLQSSSTFQGTFVMLPFLPVLFLGPALSTPDAPWLVAVSLLPPCAPILIPARMALGAVPAWELALAAVVLAVSAWLVRGGAGHAFRLGMLMYGKDVTLPELWRWSRASAREGR
jgi:ABC-2 type transport system permease protein